MADKVLRLSFVNEAGCWQAVESLEHNKGYARTWAEGRHQFLHNLAYKAFVGPIPDGMEVGHKCHDEAALAGLCTEWGTCPHHGCCNPEHLKLQTRRDNLMGSPLTQCAINRAKTHCKRNHEFNEENTRYRPNGNRSCKACDRMTKEERKEWDRIHDLQTT